MPKARGRLAIIQCGRELCRITPGTSVNVVASTSGAARATWPKAVCIVCVLLQLKLGAHLKKKAVAHAMNNDVNLPGLARWPSGRVSCLSSSTSRC